MDSSMKERNDKESWAAYEEEGKKLMEEARKRRDAVLKKYEDTAYPPGLDTDPANQELGEVTKWFGEEIEKLRKKYGIEQVRTESVG